MYNYFMLIGNVVNNPELRELSDGRKVVTLGIAIRRDFKSQDGTYETDILNVSFWEFLAELASKAKKGTKIGCKGRIYPKKNEASDGTKYTSNELFADRILFFTKKDDILDDEVASKNQDIEKGE
jgi:single-strand DNA-binding protein